MAIKFRRLNLPFVRVSSAKTGRTYTWHLGPWQYNARTGKHTMKLTKKVRWESKTRSQRVKSKKEKTTRRAAERQQWDAKVSGGQVEGLTVPADVKAEGISVRVERGRLAPTVGVHSPTSRGRGGPNDLGVPATEASGGGYPTNVADFLDSRTCRKRTAGGGICKNSASNCPPGTHAPDAERASLDQLRADRERVNAEQAEKAKAELRAQGWPIPGEPWSPAGEALPFEQRQERARSVGLCGARTKDGTACLNGSGCPHHRGGAR